MITIAKMLDGRLVEIVGTADRVSFSEDRGWISICIDFEKPKHFQDNVKWIPASTRFIWVKEFVI